MIWENVILILPQKTSYMRSFQFAKIYTSPPKLYTLCQRKESFWLSVSFFMIIADNWEEFVCVGV